MTPTNAIFNQMYIISEQIMDTYDYLPDAETRYPFCYVGNPDNIQREMNDLTGRVTVMVHWFGKRTDRKKIDDGIVKFHDATVRIKTEFPYNMQRTAWREYPQPESPDAPGVLHFATELEITYTKKG